VNNGSILGNGGWTVENIESRGVKGLARRGINKPASQSTATADDWLAD